VVKNLGQNKHAKKKPLDLIQSLFGPNWTIGRPLKTQKMLDKGYLNTNGEEEDHKALGKSCFNTNEQEENHWHPK
jgi:hypothetical protein